MSTRPRRTCSSCSSRRTAERQRRRRMHRHSRCRGSGNNCACSPLQWRSRLRVEQELLRDRRIVDAEPDIEERQRARIEILQVDGRCPAGTGYRTSDPRSPDSALDPALHGVRFVGEKRCETASPSGPDRWYTCPAARSNNQGASRRIVRSIGAGRQFLQETGLPVFIYIRVGQQRAGIVRIGVRIAQQHGHRVGHFRLHPGPDRPVSRISLRCHRE